MVPWAQPKPSTQTVVFAGQGSETDRQTDGRTDEQTTPHGSSMRPNNDFNKNLQQILRMKESWKSVSTSPSYWQALSWLAYVKTSRESKYAVIGWLGTRMGPRNHVLDGGSASPHGEGHFWGEEGTFHHKVCGHSHSAIICAKTAELIEMRLYVKLLWPPVKDATTP